MIRMLLIIIWSVNVNGTDVKFTTINTNTNDKTSK